MTCRSKVLNGIVPYAEMGISPEDASKLNIKNGEMVRTISRRGEIEIRAKITDRVHEGIVFIPFHFVEASANRLTNDALDPIAKIHEYKVCSVKIEK